MTTRFFTLIVLLALGAITARAQEEIEPTRNFIGLLGRGDRDSIVLRWAPNTPVAWDAANTRGYIVERTRVAADGSLIDAEFQTLTPTPLKPWSLAEFGERIGKEHRYAAIAAQMLYGNADPSEGSSSDIQTMRNAANIFSNRHGFALFAADMDPLAADGLALRFVDRTVSADTRYVYRIYVAGEDSSTVVDTSYLEIAAVKAEQATPPMEAHADGQDGSIVLGWNIRSTPFTAYHVERSEDGGRNYRRLTKTPLVPMIRNAGESATEASYRDSTIGNYREYRYRIIGITPFGDESAPAEAMAMGRDLTPPPSPMQHTPLQVGARSVKVSWSMQGNTGDLAGFVVARGDSSLGMPHPIFQKTLPATTFEYVDNDANVDEPYYTVLAVDTAGNISRSYSALAVIIDTTAPAVPTGLVGTIDTNGVVRLSWNIGRERNLMGYRVQFANQLDHEWSELTQKSLLDTSFRDTITLKTLSKDIYYRVIAESDRYIRSAPSKPIALRRPDIVAPVAAVFTDVTVDSAAVMLSWIPSTSEDVASQILYRRRSDSTWKEIGRFDRARATFSDISITPRVNYEYRIVTLDSAGLRSAPSASVVGRGFGGFTRPGIDGLRAEYDSTKGRVRLAWKGSVEKGSQVVIYRGRNGASPSAYRSVNGGVASYEDAALAGKGRYSYAARVIGADGVESPLSAAVTIDIKE